MAKARKVLPPLHIGEWIAYLGRKQVDVANGAGIEDSYLSLLIKGTRNNPAAVVVKAIADELGLAMNDLYRKPPPREVAQRVHQLRPDQMAALGDLLDEFQGLSRSKPPKPPKK